MKFSLRECCFLILIVLSSCKILKCKGFIGEYDDKGQTLSIQFIDKSFYLIEGSQRLPCECNDKGQLEIKGARGNVKILLSDSAGRKRFCFEEDSLREDCVYEKRK